LKDLVQSTSDAKKISNSFTGRGYKFLFLLSSILALQQPDSSCVLERLLEAIILPTRTSVLMRLDLYLPGLICDQIYFLINGR